MENLLKAPGVFVDFILKEWLLAVSGISLILTSIYARHIPVYSVNEWEVLFILFVLFITVNGLQQSGFISTLARGIERGKRIPLKLVLATYFLSMLVTNDIALIVIVPLTLSLNVNRKGILVILEALAANAGSALTPFGNPQNLFIYWFYKVNAFSFIKIISPFSLSFLLILLISSLFVKTRNGAREPEGVQTVNKKAYIYGILFFIVLLTVFHRLPVLTGIVVILFALLFDRKSLRIDYALLFTFLFFFGIAENIKLLLASEIGRAGHIFLFSALVSQLISNVPATLLFAKFTSRWEALLWGANAGGFGSLFGSLANLIAYKIYINHEGSDKTPLFTVKFLTIGYAAFFISIALYFLLYPSPGLF
ncbi:MAG: hypothetical protein GXO70_11830 [Acidobacteria bacterium]|nr:hypothetical protein [Acidobacteriota bacterium]